MKLSYYGNKISDNMSVTPEGYLTCLNVPIGRIGWMDYYGQELPSDFNEPYGSLCKVYRSPEELFSDATIASFEGKSVTNTHPTSNLDINTTAMIERGHAQNIRRDGDFLVADLIVKDAGLISEIQNNLKREVSSGYDCYWHKIGDGKYEQRNIIGNHVAVVPNGRAGSKVAIQDSKPEIKQILGGKKYMGKITKQVLAAMGLKSYAQDAEPEDIAKAMDAFNEEEEKKEVKDEEPEKKEVKDDDPKEEAKDDETIPAWAQALIEEVKSLKVGEKKVADDAEAIMDSIEEDLDGKEEVKDEEPEEKEEEKEPVEKGKAADAALKKFVQDMKPIIMAIPDEKTRTEAAKKFRSTVKDARACNVNGYAGILSNMSNHKKSAMDAAAHQRLTTTEAAEKSCKAWNAAGEKMKNNK
ncbi:hypothetical protein CLPUN_42280 [Clostridium puniceum]|uniref:DUF2213 domain-containing protein n=1 Tax=Clostridium puniceum TaxID=29367 RepID=A0A1S8T875_9CLOT|nr:DUF2213 domain-containing protein [Clostridium puniceum]OOM73990.1 hypothetical protein CLPUN_42280 [Clostridium puniceum]